MKRLAGVLFVTLLSTSLASDTFAQVTTGPGGSGVTVGNSGLITELDLSDTFTGTPDGGNANRPYAAAIQPAAAYLLENTYGNVGRSWTNSFSFTQDPSAGGAGFSNGTPAYPGDANSGSATGFTQTGGAVDYGVNFGLRNKFVAQFDAVQNTDRVDVTVSSAQGGLASANGLSVFFRQTGAATEIGLFRGGVGETSTGFTSGIPAGGATWNNYAVAFDRPNNSIEVFVNEVSRGSVDLNTFAGGAYANFNSDNVNFGGSGGNRVWTDNAQIGSSQAAIGPASLVSYLNFDESATGTGTAFDQVHANNGTFQGTATRAAGLIGTGAAQFNNDNSDGVNLGNGQNGVDNLFSFTTGMTVGAVFSSTDLDGGQQEIFRKEDGNDRILLSFQSGTNINSAGQFVGGVDEGLPGLSFGINTGGTYTELDIELDGQDGRPLLADLADGELHQVLAVYDAASGNKAIYLDGELLGEANLTPGDLLLTGGAANAFLGSSNGTSEPFSGLLDEFAIYNAALTPDQIAAQFANVQAGNSIFAVAVPEPASIAIWTLLGFVAGMFALRKRRGNR